jgi:hypothetical protein
MSYYEEKRLWASVLMMAYTDAMDWVASSLSSEHLSLGHPHYEAFTAFQVLFDPKHRCGSIPTEDLLRWFEVNPSAVRDKFKAQIKEKHGEAGLKVVNRAIRSIMYRDQHRNLSRKQDEAYLDMVM